MNHRHGDFQSPALPTELPGLARCEGPGIGKSCAHVQTSKAVLVNRFVAIAILKIDWLFSQRFGHDIGLVKPAAKVDIGAAF